MLPPAPSHPVGPDHKPRFGKYQGSLSSVEWSGVAGRLDRALREKTWFYVSIANEKIVLAAAVIDVGWSMSAFAYLFDRQKRELVADLNAVGPPFFSGDVARSPMGGAHFNLPGLQVELKQQAGRLDLWVNSRKLEVRATLDLDRAAPALVAISPVPGGIVGCTQKTSTVPVHSGFATAGDHSVDLGGAWGAVDYSCGLLARETQWRWASAAGVDPSGKPVGLNLTTGFNAQEDVVWVGNEVFPVGPARLEFDTPLETWRVTTGDGRVDLKFEPEGHRAQNTNLVFAKSIYTQPIGSFTGTVRTDGGDVRFERVPGVTEVHLAKW